MTTAVAPFYLIAYHAIEETQGHLLHHKKIKYNKYMAFCCRFKPLLLLDYTSHIGMSCIFQTALKCCKIQTLVEIFVFQVFICFCKMLMQKWWQQNREFIGLFPNTSLRVCIPRLESQEMAFGNADPYPSLTPWKLVKNDLMVLFSFYLAIFVVQYDPPVFEHFYSLIHIDGSWSVPMIMS